MMEESKRTDVKMKKPDSNSTVWSLFGRKAVAGDRDAAGQLLEHYLPVLRDMAQKQIPKLVLSRVGPSDLVQQTCTEICTSISNVSATNGSQLWAWIRSVMLRNLVDVHRRFVSCRKRSVLKERTLDEPGRNLLMSWKSCSPLEQAIHAEEVSRLKVAMSRLTDAHCTVLRWRYEEGLTYSEIGERVNRSEDAVRMHVRRAEQALQRQLGQLD